MKIMLFIDSAENRLIIMGNMGLLEADRTGGYMTVLSPKTRAVDVPLLRAEIGEITLTDRLAKYYLFSGEKGERVVLNNPLGHVSSWQSRDPEQDKWGGAIRAGDFVLSFSGLPELADEALMLAVALDLNLLTLEEANRIADISNNHIFRTMPLDRYK